jgi:hypothetical protein
LPTDWFDTLKIFFASGCSNLYFKKSRRDVCTKAAKDILLQSVKARSPRKNIFKATSRVNEYRFSPALKQPECQHLRHPATCREQDPISIVNRQVHH